MKFIDKVAWLEIQNQKVLVARSKSKDRFYIPGGKREGQETDIQTLQREIMEELNVEILSESIEFAGEFSAQAHGHKEGLKVRMRCYYGLYKGELKACSEIEALAWMDCSDYEYISFVDKKIFQWLAKQGKID